MTSLRCRRRNTSPSSRYAGAIFNSPPLHEKRIDGVCALWRKNKLESLRWFISCIDLFPVCGDGFTTSDPQRGWHTAHLTRVSQDRGAVYFLQRVCCLFFIISLLIFFLLLFLLNRSCCLSQKQKVTELLFKNKAAKRKWLFLVLSYYNSFLLQTETPAAKWYSAISGFIILPLCFSHCDAFNRPPWQKSSAAICDVCLPSPRRSKAPRSCWTKTWRSWSAKCGWPSRIPSPLWRKIVKSRCWPRHTTWPWTVRTCWTLWTKPESGPTWRSRWPPSGDSKRFFSASGPWRTSVSKK